MSKFNTTIKCYDCQSFVVDLKDHRKSCSKPKNTVKCFDCHAQVVDLKEHRKSCDKSKKSKTMLIPHIEKKEETTDRYLLFDTSGSMTGNRIQTAKETALEIFEKYAENDRIAVITFDTQPYFRLKPHPVGKIRRQNELPDLFSRFMTQGGTSIWDAIWMAVEQIQGDSNVILNVITDGEDNMSKHTYEDVLKLIESKPKVKLNIINISDRDNVQYKTLCEKSLGIYKTITEIEIKITMINIL